MKAENYIPYGEEWKTELMKMTKKDLIAIYKMSCVKNKELIDKNNQLIKDSMQVDHADTCMCKSCEPEFNKLKK